MMYGCVQKETILRGVEATGPDLAGGASVGNPVSESIPVPLANLACGKNMSCF